MSQNDTLEFDDGRVRAAGAADTRPAPAWYTFNWDATKAAASDAFWDAPGRAHDVRNSDILTAAAELTRINGKSMSAYQAIPMGGEAGVPIALENAFWNDLAQVRQTRPDALKDFAVDKADYDRKLTARFQQGAASRAERMSRNGLLGNLAGGMAGAFTDPINLATLPVGGGGRTAAMRIVTEGLANAGIEFAEQPLVALERGQQGRDFSMGEAAWNVALAGVGGAGFKAAEIGGGKVLGKAVAKVGDALPLDVRAAMALRTAKPDFALTPDEAAALHVITRGAEVDGTSPFAHTYDGLEAHAQRVNATIAAMARWPEAGATQAFAPRARSIGSGIAPDLDRAWAAIIRNERGTARDGSFLTSPKGAIGPAQVMPGTAPEAARLAGLPWDEARYRSNHAYNEALGKAYYAEMLRQFDGDPSKAAAAYNAGPGSARKGTGLRGAMARAERAGVPEEWVSFLPAETRQYVADFRRRSGMGGAAIDPAELGRMGDIGDFGQPARPAGLDAERPSVDMPELDRAQFRSEAEWKRAQGEVDADAFGADPSAARHAVWIEARDRLMADKAGEVAGALWHPEIGAIDVKWGDDTAGLAKIAIKHPEVLEDLPAVLSEMEVIDRSKPGRVKLESLDHSAVVRLDWDDKAQTWLLTAFQREEPKLRGKGRAPSPEVSMRSGELAGASPTAGAMRDIALSRAGVQLGENVGDFGRWWESEMARGARVRPVHALVDGAGIVRGWETTAPRAARQLDRLGLEDGRVVTIDPPRHADLGQNSAARDELEAAGAAGAVLHDAEAGKAFDDPAGAGVAKAGDTAWHDLQAGVAAVRQVEGAIDDLDAALREVSPELVDQLNREIAAATRGLPEQLSFDLGDGKGERTLADIADELRAEEDGMAQIESCLRPAPMGGMA